MFLPVSRVQVFFPQPPESFIKQNEGQNNHISMETCETYIYVSPLCSYMTVYDMILGVETPKFGNHFSVLQCKVKAVFSCI